MIIELGYYKAKRTMILNRYNIAIGQVVNVNQLILNEDIDLCSATVVISKSEQIRVPIESFVKNFVRMKGRINETESKQISLR